MSTTATNSTIDEQPAEALLARVRGLIDPVLRAAVDSMPIQLGRMGAYHFGWVDATGAAAAGVPGKGLRPALTLVAAAACGAEPAAAVQVAAGVELLHNFALIHDDVMDRDAFRHARPTVWRVWGVTNALLLGDALQALAIGVIAEGMPEPMIGESVARVVNTMLTVCAGQYDDCAFEQRPSVEVGEYLSMAAAKTGALLGCACALGALCAGADQLLVARMNTFGRELGVAFQLVDDVIGIHGDPRVTGKPAGADLIRRKQSFPVVCTLGSQSMAGQRLSRLYRRPGPMTPAEVAAAVGSITEAGGLEQTLRCARDRVQAALEVLPPEVITDDLRTLADLAAQRDR
ncbi:polyprenyl synthetase family protein [Nocardia brasiliensis]|uniref:polyprenyl synthetase family protein n=1 Tax=Nocardia brasiliensis TaxID=37326 RepID=UPI002454776A|nr:polyprenyl synthetase family protein [Nocardia brasiliensis]